MKAVDEGQETFCAFQSKKRTGIGRRLSKKGQDERRTKLLPCGERMVIAMQLTLPTHVCACMEALERAGFEAWAVGGCVRDMLRGVPPHDYDLATSALPEDTLRLFPGSVPTGLTYGTVTVVTPQGPLEITTFRTEADYQGFRRPENVRFTERLCDDLSRRDFTINAMAYAPAKGLCDAFGGEADLRARLIRAVGEPARRFEEDALRVLRAFRFASRLVFSIESQTLYAALSAGKHLAKISVERVAAELLKSLAGEKPSALFPLLQSGALAFCGLNLPACANPEAFDHLPRADSLRLAALCVLCGTQASAVCAALKVSRALRQMTAAYALQLEQPLPCTRCELKGRFSVLPPEHWSALLQARALLFGEETGALQAQTLLARREPWRLDQLAVNGNDLRSPGIPAGRETGEALKALLQIVMEHPEWNQKERLLQIAKRHLEGDALV